MHIKAWGSVQNGCHFVDNILKYIYLIETFPILTQISLKFISYGTIGSSNGFEFRRLQDFTWFDVDPDLW